MEKEVPGHGKAGTAVREGDGDERGLRVSRARCCSKGRPETVSVKALQALQRPPLCPASPLSLQQESSPEGAGAGPDAWPPGPGLAWGPRSAHSALSVWHHGRRIL